MRAIHYEAHLLEAFGEHEEAIAAARKGIATAEGTGLARTSGAVHSIDLVEALAVSGRWDEALEAAERGLELAPTPALRAHLLRHRASIALARGDTALPATVIEENRALGSDPHELLPLIVLEIDLALVEGRPDDAESIAGGAVEEHDLRRTSRFSWPLLVAAAEAGAGESLRDVRADLPVTGPIQRAHAVYFDAATGSATWDEAASAWEVAGDPYRTALALTKAARALATSDRAASSVRLTRAFDLASDLRAEPLLAEIADLARRAGVSLGEPTSHSENVFDLTSREMDVLRLVVEGHDNRQIAAQLFITAKTASVHVSNIKAKLGAGSRTETAAIARHNGLA
nr:response regulator transcription factor [Haloechinothrix aidingensis]